MRVNSAKALMSFVRSGDAKLYQFVKAALPAISANPAFVSIMTSVDAAKVISDDFAYALLASVKGNAEQVAEKNRLKGLLKTAMRKVVDNVNYVAQGNRPLLISTKLDVSKETHTPVTLEPVKKFTVENGSTGEMNLSIKKGVGTNGVAFQYTETLAIDAQTQWVSAFVKKDRYTFTNLPVGKFLNFRVVVMGTREQSFQTDAVKKMVA